MNGSLRHSTAIRAPTARLIPAWANGPGKSRIENTRAEGPIQVPRRTRRLDRAFSPGWYGNGPLALRRRRTECLSMLAALAGVLDMHLPVTTGRFEIQNQK